MFVLRSTFLAFGRSVRATHPVIDLAFGDKQKLIKCDTSKQRTRLRLGIRKWSMYELRHGPNFNCSSTTDSSDQLGYICQPGRPSVFLQVRALDV